MRQRIADRLNAFFARYFPEQRLFLKTDSGTRFVRLRPAPQALALTGAAAITGWAIVATAVVVTGSLGTGNLRDQATQRRADFEKRLNTLATERDARAVEAERAQDRFSAALREVSAMQSRLLAAETRQRELKTGLGAVRGALQETVAERDAARSRSRTLADRLSGDGAGGRSPEARLTDASQSLDFVTAALDRTAAERDELATERAAAEKEIDELERANELQRERSDRIFARLEDALTVSVEPLKKMFRAAGLSPDNMIAEVRRGYTGQGGPLHGVSLSTKGTGPSPDALRARQIMERLDRMNLYREAAEKAPFAVPVHSSYRVTSPFGMRSHPISGGRKMHEGDDLAAPYGTPIHATADGVVTYAKWMSGYGRLVEIEHAFGLSTRYGHMSKIRVKKGQRVSRGDRIGDMGSSGNSTGSHTHYEVRRNGTPINPMTFIKAARDVF